MFPDVQKGVYGSHYDQNEKHKRVHRTIVEGAGNPNGAQALKGNQVGNQQAVAAVKANAEHRAANLQGIIDDLRSQGIRSIRAIAAELNGRGILTPRSGTWHPTSVARLLARLSN